MRLRALLLPVGLALAVTACGGKATDNEPAPPPRGPCPASHDLVNGRCVMREIYFMGGTFVMGRGYCPKAHALTAPVSYQCPLADRPHQVMVKPFYVDATVWSYTVLKDLKHFDDTCTPDSACNPVILGLSSPTPYDDLSSYCKSRGMRLLTEAEWEYIATRGGKRMYPWGNEEPTCGRANIDASCRLQWPVPGHPHIAQVASYPPTPEGVYDLAGNIAEVLAPSPGAYTGGYTALPAQSPACTGAPDGCCGSTPNGWCDDEKLFPARGGSWQGPRDHLHSAYRDVAVYSYLADDEANKTHMPKRGGYTFRCARDAN